MSTEIVELEGHIVDSLLLAKVLDLILESEADYRITSFDLGRTNLDPSRAVIEVSMDDEAVLDALLEQLQVHGVNRIGDHDATVETCDRDGVLPEGFYSTTNLNTEVRIEGHWRRVDRCGWRGRWRMPVPPRGSPPGPPRSAGASPRTPAHSRWRSPSTPR